MRKVNRGWGAGLALVVAVASLLGLGAVPARAADNGSWSVEPTSQRGTTPRQYFIYDLVAGSEINDSVTIVNDTKLHQVFRVYGTDGYTTGRDGALGFRVQNEAQVGIGSWLKVAQPSVTVPPLGRVVVPFTLTVPHATAPGDHVGGVVALSTRIERGMQGGSVVGTQKAVAARVYGRVKGPVQAGLTISDVTVDRKAKPPTVSYTLLNTGNIRLTPTTTVAVSGLLGRNLQNIPATTPSLLLPGEQSTFTQPLGKLPFLDYVTVTVVASSDEVSAVGATHVLILPWWILALLAALVLALAGYGWWRRRRRRTARRAGVSTEELVSV